MRRHREEGFGRHGGSETDHGLDLDVKYRLFGLGHSDRTRTGWCNFFSSSVEVGHCIANGVLLFLEVAEFVVPWH